MNAETQQCEHVNMRRVLLVAGMAALLAALVLAQPWHTHIDIGNLYDYPFLRNFYGAEYSEEHQTTFRWTRPQADLLLPGAGRVAPLTMRVHGDYPDMPLRLDDGTGTIALNLRHGWQRVSLLPRPHPWSGDVVLHINAPPQQSDSDGNVSPTPGSAGGSPAPARGLAPPTPYLITQTTFTNRVQSATDPRDRGVVLDWVTINGLRNTPPPLQVLLIGINAALCTLLVQHLSRRPWVAVLAGTMFTLALGAILFLNGGAWRLMLTSFTARLTMALLLGVVLVYSIKAFLKWLTARRIIALTHRGRTMDSDGKVRPTPGSPGGSPAPGRGLAVPNPYLITNPPFTNRFTMLAGVAVLAFLLRFCGMAYPLTFISDIRFTMARATLVREGELLKIFLPNPELTPVQWETEATIPRSPFYYILASPLTALPGDSARLSVMAFSSLIDALAVLLVALLVLQLTRSQRAAALAGLLAATLPLGLLAAVSWGLFPTLLAQCLMLLAMLVWLHLHPRLHERRPRRIFTATLAVAYLAYPTALLFLGTTWAILLVLLFITRDTAARPTLWAGLTALLIALVLFYGWHIPAMLQTTFPVLLEKMSSEGSGGEPLRLLDMWHAVWTPLVVKYGWLVMGLASGGALLLATRQKTENTRKGGTLLLIAWAATYPLMALTSEYVVTFILKDVLYMLPALAILGGLLLGKLAHYRMGKLVVTLLLAFIGWQGITLEIHAIIYEFVQLKW